LQLGTLSHDTRQAPTPKKGKHDGKNRKTKEKKKEQTITNKLRKKKNAEKETSKSSPLTRLYQIIQKILNFKSP
jgi:hypothetical protein